MASTAKNQLMSASNCPHPWVRLARNPRENHGFEPSGVMSFAAGAFRYRCCLAENDSRTRKSSNAGRFAGLNLYRDRSLPFPVSENPSQRHRDHFSITGTTITDDDGSHRTNHPRRAGLRSFDQGTPGARSLLVLIDRAWRELQSKPARRPNGSNHANEIIE